MRLSAEQLHQAYLAACETELLAYKPGNVSVYAEGHDMTVEQFRLSARVSAPWLCEFGLSLGEKMFYAVRATREAVGCNTNLGIILLAGPLLHAAQQGRAGEALHSRLQRVLAQTTKQDAEWVYRGIRLAQPAGLGTASEQDVHESPEVTLTEAMALASARDRIACQYSNCYADIFDLAMNRYHTAFARWGERSWAALAVYVDLLRQIPDSHVERKFGNQFTGTLMTRMALLAEELSQTDRPEQLIGQLREVDEEFKAAGINPGTTADLTVACLLAVYLEELLIASCAA